MSGLGLSVTHNYKVAQKQVSYSIFSSLIQDRFYQTDQGVVGEAAKSIC